MAIRWRRTVLATGLLFVLVALGLGATHRWSSASHEALAWLHAGSHPAESAVGPIRWLVPTYASTRVMKYDGRDSACAHRSFVIGGDTGWAWVDVYLRQVDRGSWARHEMTVGRWTKPAIPCRPA